MRISDWSSDVCSSDLNLPPLPLTLADILKHPGIEHAHPPLFERNHARFLPALELAVDMLAAHAREIAEFGLAQFDALRRLDILADQPFRSEEHTSELQSLMRISYAVFCLKKKNTHKTTPH